MLDRLEECADTYQVRLFNYCLMPNHVHLLVETPLANLDRFMSSLLTGYTVYYNKKHQRPGHVMQGRYGAQLVSGDGYLLNLSRYIHLNPVKTDYWQNQPIESQREFLRQYAWSSFRSFIGTTPPLSCLHPRPILALLPNNSAENPQAAYLQFVETGLAKSDQEFTQLMRAKPIALGPESFVRDIKSRYEEAAKVRVKKEDMVLRKVLSSASPEAIFSAVGKLTGFKRERLLKSHSGYLERCLMALALQKYAGQTQRDIANMLGVTTGAAISSLIRKHREAPEVINWLNELNLTFKG